jgi:hypothetical protein
MQPEYKQAFLGKQMYTLDQLKHEARSAQELIKSMRTYKPPSVSGSHETSLARKPVAPVPEVQKDLSTMALETGKTSHKLHMVSVDPYAYHHPAGKKQVTVEGEPGHVPQSKLLHYHETGLLQDDQILHSLQIEIQVERTVETPERWAISRGIVLIRIREPIRKTGRPAKTSDSVEAVVNSSNVNSSLRPFISVTLLGHIFPAFLDTG